MSPLIDVAKQLADAAIESAPIEGLHDHLMPWPTPSKSATPAIAMSRFKCSLTPSKNPNFRKQALAALGCGAIVEHGGNATVAFEAILKRLPDALRQALAYRDACHDAEKKAAAKRGGEPEPFFFHQDKNSAEQPASDPSQIWEWLDSLARGANAMLSRSMEARKRARSIPEIRELAGAWRMITSRPATSLN